MDYITRTGMLDGTPELEDDVWEECTSAIVQVEGEGPYRLDVRGRQARLLVETARRADAVRVTFTGRHHVGENGHEVRIEVTRPVLCTMV